jgi:drug/metabolite transporter (DMT)-like permease
MSSSKAGILMGLGAILLWSTAAASTFWCGSRIGAWQFLAVACGVGGIAQLGYAAAARRNLRAILLPPPRLWALILVGFVLYMMVYAEALVGSTTRTQAVGVSLINHMWTVLTVVFSAFLVPGSALTPRVVLALALALGGMLLANGGQLAALLAASGEPGESAPLGPYLLAGLAAVLWAGYSAFVARWRDWANRYATATVGFLVVSVLSAGLCTWRQQWQAMDLTLWGVVIFGGLGPYAAGYLLWELALHRASPSVLGLLAAATPVLSAVCMLVMFALSPGEARGEPAYVRLLLGAALIALAVVVAMIPSRAERTGGGESC